MADGQHLYKSFGGKPWQVSAFWCDLLSCILLLGLPYRSLRGLRSPIVSVVEGFLGNSVGVNGWPRGCRTVACRQWGSPRGRASGRFMPLVPTINYSALRGVRLPCAGCLRAAAAWRLLEALDPYGPGASRGSSDGVAMGVPSRGGRSTIVTWLILPVVICLSQRLSHACLSISNYTVKLRMAH
jgi:hypothetical protein